MAEAAAKLAAEPARCRLEEAAGGGDEILPEELGRSPGRCPRCVGCSPRIVLVDSSSWALSFFL